MILSPLAALLLPLFTQAAAPLGTCPAASAFLEQIYNCGQNKLVIDYGRACADAQIAASRAQGAKLAAVMAEMGKNLGEAQNRSLVDATKRLQITVRELSRQIQSLQKHTKTVENYTESMIDFADGKDDSTSAECFSENFHGLQKIVNEMDQEILNSKKALQSALTMLASLKKSETNLEGSLRGSEAAASNGAKGLGAGTAKRPATAPNGQAKGSGSDISGTERLQKKKLTQ